MPRSVQRPNYDHVREPATFEMSTLADGKRAREGDGAQADHAILKDERGITGTQLAGWMAVRAKG